jgi:hypothetical protein
MAPPEQAANDPQIEWTGNCERHKEKSPVPRLKARLVEAHREVRGLYEQSNFRGAQCRRQSAAPHGNWRRSNGLHATTADEPQEETQRDGAENDREHELAEKRDNCGTRSRQRYADDIGTNQENFRDTTFEC